MPKSTCRTACWHPDPMTASHPAVLSTVTRLRRRALVIGALVSSLLVVSVWSTASVPASASDTVLSLDDPGNALRTAERIALRPPPVPEGRIHRDLPVPAPGLLNFPVDAASNCYLSRSSFGASRDGGARGHEGTDIMGSAGREVYAIANGVLEKRYTNTGTAGFGWTLRDPQTGVVYRYFHLAENPAGRVQGDDVVIGDVIGYVGDTGTTVGNFHLHLEVRPDNSPVNPVGLLDVPTPPCRVGS